MPEHAWLYISANVQMSQALYRSKICKQWERYRVRIRQGYKLCINLGGLEALGSEAWACCIQEASFRQLLDV